VKDLLKFMFAGLSLPPAASTICWTRWHRSITNNHLKLHTLAYSMTVCL